MYLRLCQCVFDVVPVGILGGASVYLRWCQCVFEECQCVFERVPVCI